MRSGGWPSPLAPSKEDRVVPRGKGLPSHQCERPRRCPVWLGPRAIELALQARRTGARASPCPSGSPGPSMRGAKALPGSRSGHGDHQSNNTRHRARPPAAAPSPQIGDSPSGERWHGSCSCRAMKTKAAPTKRRRPARWSRSTHGNAALRCGETTRAKHQGIGTRQ
jgi:hypothetical protein